MHIPIGKRRSVKKAPPDPCRIGALTERKSSDYSFRHILNDLQQYCQQRYIGHHLRDVQNRSRQFYRNCGLCGDEQSFHRVVRVNPDPLDGLDDLAIREAWTTLFRIPPLVARWIEGETRTRAEFDKDANLDSAERQSSAVYVTSNDESTSIFY